MAESARRRNVTPALTAPDAQQPAGTRGCHRVSLLACLADEQPRPREVRSGRQSGRAAAWGSGGGGGGFGATRAPRGCLCLNSPPRLVDGQRGRARARGALRIAVAARALHARTPPAGREVVTKRGGASSTVAREMPHR